MYINPHDESKAIAVYHEDHQQSSEVIKARFYLTKILHMIYPDNVPNIHSVTTEPATKTMEYVRDGSKTQGPIRGFLSGRRRNNFIDELYKLNILVDEGGSNFLLNEDGNLLYIDEFYFSSLDGDKPLRGLKKLIDTRLAGSSREMALQYLERFRVAFEKIK